MFLVKNDKKNTCWVCFYWQPIKIEKGTHLVSWIAWNRGRDRKGQMEGYGNKIT